MKAKSKSKVLIAPIKILSVQNTIINKFDVGIYVKYFVFKLSQFFTLQNTQN